MVSGHPGYYEDPHARNPERLIGVTKQASYKVKNGKAMICAEAVITNPETREAFANLIEADAMDQIEFSILAQVDAKTVIQGDERHYEVSAFKKCISVDHVLRGAAGGLMLAAASKRAQGAKDSDNLDQDEELIMTNEEILALQAAKTKAESDVAAQTKRAEDAEKAAKEAEEKLAAQSRTLLTREITLAIQSSTLPDNAKAKLVAQAGSIESVEKAKEVIAAEADYLKSLGVTAKGAPSTTAQGKTDDGTPTPSGVKNAGASAPVVTEQRVNTGGEKDPDAPSADPKKDPLYITAYQRCRLAGQSEETADRNARVEAMLV